MKVKLSELRNDEKLLFGDSLITKEDILDNLDYYREKVVNIGRWPYSLNTTETYHATLDAKAILSHAIEEESYNMYEGWDTGILKNLTEEDIQELQAVLNKILNKNTKPNYSYQEDKEVEFDL